MLEKLNQLDKAVDDSNARIKSLEDIVKQHDYKHDQT
jgi:hypothetical protein